MAKKCEMTGKGVQVGHRVSHSNIKTKHRFLPNLQKKTVLVRLPWQVRHPQGEYGSHSDHRQDWSRSLCPTRRN